MNIKFKIENKIYLQTIGDFLVRSKMIKKHYSENKRMFSLIFIVKYAIIMT